MQMDAMFRVMATLAGEDVLKGAKRWNGAAQTAWMVHLDSVCSNCGASRSTREWDSMWNTCAPCGRKLDYGSEQSMLPPECRDDYEPQDDDRDDLAAEAEYLAAERLAKKYEPTERPC